MDRKNATRASRYVFEVLQAYDVVLWRYFFQVGSRAGRDRGSEAEKKGGRARCRRGFEGRWNGTAESIDWHRG